MMNPSSQSLSDLEKEQLVFAEYDFFPERIEQYGRVKKISCHRGIFALKKTAVESKQLQLVDHLLSVLSKHGFTHHLPFYPTKFGDAYVSIEGDHYYVTRWLEDRVESKYKADWESQMMAGLGRLHQATANLDVQTRVPVLSAEVLLQRWNHRLEQMSQYKEMAEQRGLMSPIEGAFIAQFDYLYAISTKAIRYLEKWNTRIRQSQKVRTVLCHGHVHRQHVLNDLEQFYLINFDYMNMDLPARELALFYRRHLDQHLEWNADVGLYWLEQYEQFFPLEKEEKLILAIYLMFPERVFKEMERYYQGERDWHPLKLAHYLEKQVEMTHLIRRFVREMLL